MSDELAALSKTGVSIWLDDLSRKRLVSGSLADLAARDQVAGVTTNPAIFAKAITGSNAYGPQVLDLAVRGVDARDALRALTTFDVRWLVMCCDRSRTRRAAWAGPDRRSSPGHPGDLGDLGDLGAVARGHRQHLRRRLRDQLPERGALTTARNSQYRFKTCGAVASGHTADRPAGHSIADQGASPHSEAKR